MGMWPAIKVAAIGGMLAVLLAIGITAAAKEKECQGMEGYERGSLEQPAGVEACIMEANMIMDAGIIILIALAITATLINVYANLRAAREGRGQ